MEESAIQRLTISYAAERQAADDTLLNYRNLEGDEALDNQH